MGTQVLTVVATVAALYMRVSEFCQRRIDALLDLYVVLNSWLPRRVASAMDILVVRAGLPILSCGRVAFSAFVVSVVTSFAALWNIRLLAKIAAGSVTAPVVSLWRRFGHFCLELEDSLRAVPARPLPEKATRYSRPGRKVSRVRSNASRSIPEDELYAERAKQDAEWAAVDSAWISEAQPVEAGKLVTEPTEVATPCGARAVLTVSQARHDFRAVLSGLKRAVYNAGNRGRHVVTGGVGEAS